MSENQQRSGKL
ncbi:Protein of unknown function [Bacillus wiedmannii]|nr:Protein of unknown function [Bacillus wiedmannii]